MSIKRRVKNRRKKKNDLVNGSSENNKEHKKFKTIIKDKKYLLDQSFTFGITDKTSKEEYFYYSDSEEKQKKIKNNQMKSNMSLIDALIQINEQELQTAIKDIKKRNKKTLKNKLAQRINEETEEGLDSLIREYNKKRADDLFTKRKRKNQYCLRQRRTAGTHHECTRQQQSRAATTGVMT